eukprot:RCo019004
MLSGFQFSNLLGGTYTGGNVLFDRSGHSLLSPVGNRVTAYDLQNSSTVTLPFETPRDIVAMDLSPNEELLFVADERGLGIFLYYPTAQSLERYRCGQPVSAVRFSPCGKFLALCLPSELRVITCPPTNLLLYRSVTVLANYRFAIAPVTCVEWTSTSEGLVSGSEDSVVRILPRVQYSLRGTERPTRPLTLSAHRAPVVGVWFGGPADDVLFSVARNYTLCIWHKTDESVLEKRLAARLLRAKEARKRKREMSGNASSEEEPGEEEEEEDRQEPPEVAEEGSAGPKEEEGTEGKDASGAAGAASGQLKPWEAMWKLHRKHIMALAQPIYCAAYIAKQAMLVCGFRDGTFALYKLDRVEDVVCLQTLSLSAQKISAAAVSPSGEWLAFGSAKLGQLLVWEWRSETYVLRQQAHRAGDVSV